MHCNPSYVVINNLNIPQSEGKLHSTIELLMARYTPVSV